MGKGKLFKRDSLFDVVCFDVSHSISLDLKFVNLLCKSVRDSKSVPHQPTGTYRYPTHTPQNQELRVICYANTQFVYVFYVL